MIGSLMMCMSVVILLFGMLAGIVMGIAQDFTLAPAHAHLNLIGGVLLFLFGLYYRLVPAAGTTTLAKWQGWLHMIGAILFPAGVALVLTKGDSFEAAPIVGSLVVIAAMALFAVIVFRTSAHSRRAQLWGDGGLRRRGLAVRRSPRPQVTSPDSACDPARRRWRRRRPSRPARRAGRCRRSLPHRRPGISLVSGTTCGSYPSLLTVTVMSALRLATTTQGVTQAVGLSSPDNSAVAPGGVDAIEMFSVVPRVTDAQPTHGNATAAANSSPDHWIFSPSPPKIFAQPQRESKGSSRRRWGMR